MFLELGFQLVDLFAVPPDSGIIELNPLPQEQKSNRGEKSSLPKDPNQQQYGEDTKHRRPLYAACVDYATGWLREEWSYQG